MKTWQKLKANPKLFQRYYVKEYIIRAIREFFITKNYHELESPIIAPALPQEHYLNPVTTEIIAKSNANKVSKKTGYLIPSTERYNKIMLAAGLGNHFVITKVFRGLEDSSPNHSFEFTMCEWYHLDANYFDLMKDCQSLFKYIQNYLVKNLFHKNFSHQITFQSNEINLAGDWDKLSVVDALKDFCNISLEEIQDIKKFKKVAIEKGYNISKNDDWEIIFELIFANEIEPKLNPNKPTFVYDYPLQLCPLTKVSPTNPLVAQKMELFIAGKEIANGYTELTDGVEQERRFKIEADARNSLGKTPIEFDNEIIEALKSGLPEVAGIGMGLDRLAMIFADAKSIDEINYFPTNESF